MVGQLYINGKDAWSHFGIVLEDGSRDTLLTPAPLKKFTSNSQRSQPGKQVFNDNPQPDERIVAVTFCFVWESDFIAKYDSFVAELYKGSVELRVPALGNKTFRLVYESCSNMESVIYAGKVKVTFNEPNPLNRA